MLAQKGTDKFSVPHDANASRLLSLPQAAESGVKRSETTTWGTTWSESEGGAGNSH